MVTRLGYKIKDTDCKNQVSLWNFSWEDNIEKEKKSSKSKKKMLSQDVMKKTRKIGRRMSL